MAFKTTILTTPAQIIVTLEPEDGTDKLGVELIKGCNAAKLEVNGVIRFTIERPKRPLRADLNLEGDEGGNQ